MTETELPKIKRAFPKPVVFLLSAMFYLIVVPLNWLVTHLGSSPGIVLMRGKKQKEMEARILKAFDNYTPTEHDIFVNTFSKSGTNWMLQICHQTAFLGEGEFDNIHDVVAWPDMSVQMKRKIVISLDDHRVQQASPTQLRVIKSHLAAQHIPWSEEARYITVVRDPKDVFVSSYHFMAGTFGPIMPSVDDWLESFLGDNFPIGFGASWAEHTASYWALKDQPNVLILSFREMKRDLATTVKQVADFLGVQFTEAQFARVVNKSSFDYMKGINDRFFPIQQDALPWMKVEMMRQGKEGNSKELISLEQQRRIDAHFIQELKDLGSDFPYQDYCRITGNDN